MHKLFQLPAVLTTANEFCGGGVGGGCELHCVQCTLGMDNRNNMNNRNNALATQ